VRLVELHRVHPADGVVLAEDDPTLVVEVVVVGGKARVNRRELLGLRVVNLDLPGARTRDRELLGEFVHRPVLAERGLLVRGSSSRRRRRARSCPSSRCAVGRPLPDLLVPQNGDAGCRCRAARLDGTLICVARFSRGSTTAMMSGFDGSVDQSVRVHRRRALVGGGRISPSAGRKGPVHIEITRLRSRGRRTAAPWDRRPRKSRRGQS
jgi:hypothetical protein